MRSPRHANTSIAHTLHCPALVQYREMMGQNWSYQKQVPPAFATTTKNVSGGTVHNFGFWTNFIQIGVKTAGKHGNKKHCSPCLVEAYKVWSVSVCSVLLSPTSGKTMHKILNQLFPVNNLSIDSFLFFSFGVVWYGVAVESGWWLRSSRRLSNLCMRWDRGI